MRSKLALLVTALIINISIMSAYVLPVEASVPISPVVDGLYQSFSQIFGNAWGYFKSTDEMTYNHTMEKIENMYNAMIDNLPDILEAGGLTRNALDRDEMIMMLESYKQMVSDYNNGTAENAYYDALNEQSYTASGTLVTKTLEEKLDKSIAFISAMTPVYYRAQMDMMFNSLFTEEGALAVEDMKENFMLYESFMSAYTAGQAASMMNEAWFVPVENSVYKLTDLYKTEFEFNDTKYRVYNVNTIMYKKNDNIDFIKLETGVDSYLFPVLCDNGAMRFIFASTDSHTLSWKYINTSGDITASGIANSKIDYYGNYYSFMNFYDFDNVPFDYYIMKSGDNINTLISKFNEHFNNQLKHNNPALDNADSISVKAPGLSLALDSFWDKDLTAEDVVNLADTLETTVNPLAGTETALSILMDAVAGLTITLPDAIIDGTNDVVKAVEDIGTSILTLPKAIWLEFADVMEGIKAKVVAIDTTKPWEGDFDSNSNDFVIILNGLLLLIMIILALLRIFIHCLQFIVNIFKIPASTAFLPDDVIAGLDYIKTLTIPGLGMSVYSFMMGLVYIMIVFYAVKVLRVNVDRLRVPKSKNGGLH